MIQLVWATTHQETRCQNVNEQSGKCVDIILKSSLLRQSMDNVTCIFIAFSNFNNTLFENYNDYKIEMIKKNCANINEHNIRIKEDESYKSNNQNVYNNFCQISNLNNQVLSDSRRNPSQNFDEEEIKSFKRDDSNSKKKFSETIISSKNKIKEHGDVKTKKLSHDFEQALLPSINYNLTTQGNNYHNNNYELFDEEQYKKNNKKILKVGPTNKLNNIKKIVYNTPISNLLNPPQNYKVTNNMNTNINSKNISIKK